MQSMATGGALRAPFRFQSPHPGRDFLFLHRWFTPRTVFMEVGAADCELALTAASYVERVYAIGEFLPSELLPCNLRLVRADGVRIPVRQASIDVAWSGRHLESLDAGERLEHLRSVRRSLAPGGIYFSACDAPFLEAGFSAVRCYAGNVRIPVRATRFFDRKQLRFAAR